MDCQEFQKKLLKATEDQTKLLEKAVPLLAILVRLLSTQPPLPEGVTEPDMGTTGSNNG